MHWRYLLCLLIAASALQLACGGGAATPKSAPASSTAGQLSVTPSNFSFGTVLVGNSKSLNGMLSATNSDVTVSSASWNGQGFALSGISFPATVLAGQSLSFTVTFTPQVAGSSTGSLDFVSNASNSVGAEALTGSGSQSSQYSVGLSWDPSTSPVVGFSTMNARARTRGGGVVAAACAAMTKASAARSTAAQIRRITSGKASAGGLGYLTRIFWPMCRAVGSIPGLRLMRSSTVVPYFWAREPSVSPLCTT